MFQCPLGLELLQQAKNGDSVDEQFQCPLGLIRHFYGTPSKPRFYAVSRACSCKYLSEYSDRSSFSCMFTIWTYLTRQIFPNPEFTIAQNYSSVILFFLFLLSLTPARNIVSQHLHLLPMDYNEVIKYGMLVDL